MTQFNEPVAALVDSLPGHQTPLWSLPGKPVGAYSAATDPNNFHCPSSVFRAMRESVTPLLRAVFVLGPERVQWAGQPMKSENADRNSLTCWALDGKRATQGQLLDAAKAVLTRTFRFPEGVQS